MTKIDYIISDIGVKSMIFEVLSATKPGLVDRLGSGSHSDMDIFSFISSAFSISQYLRKAEEIGAVSDLESIFDLLRSEGLLAEKKMYEVTGGANTHKGMIFTMGISVACASYVRSHGLQFEQIWKLISAVGKNSLPDFSNMCPFTYGEKSMYLHGIGGARAEVSSGLGTVRKWGYPAFKSKMESGFGLEKSALFALFSLMANTYDTNIIGRSGIKGLHFVMQTARIALRDAFENYDENYLKSLNDIYISRNLSPGGSADLLAVSIFIYFFEIYLRKDDLNGG